MGVQIGPVPPQPGQPGWYPNPPAPYPGGMPTGAPMPVTLPGQPPPQGSTPVPLPVPPQPASPGAAPVPPQPAPAPPAAPQGFGERWGNFAGNNGNMLMGLGAGLMANRQNPVANPMTSVFQNAMLGQRVDQQKQLLAESKAEEAKKKNATVEYLVKFRGLAPDEARAIVDAGLAGQLISNPEQTSAIKEFLYGQQNPAFAAEQIRLREAGRQTTTILTGKISPNTEPVDPNDLSKGFRPMKGTAAEQLPAEVAGRAGLAQSFLNEAPTIRKQIEDGTVTGWVDNANARLNSQSGAAAVYRKLEDGTEAMQRMLTGAGMPQSEAASYARRFLPDATDDSKSAMNKFDNLVNRLTAMNAAIMRGRGTLEDLKAIADGGNAGASTGGAEGVPEGVTPEQWGVMTPEQRALWQ